MGIQRKGVIFLDIDGVLNDCGWFQNGTPIRILPEPAKLLQDILEAYPCDIVLISAWRYPVLNGDVSYQNFSWMLHTHGITSACLIGCTAPDERDEANRPQLIRNYIDWATRKGKWSPSSWIVIDDYPRIGFEDRQVVPNSKTGMQEIDALKVIELLEKFKV